MSNEIVVQENAPIVAWTPNEVQLLKDTVCKGATDEELALAVQICKQTQLNPFTHQIYFLKRWDTRLNKEVISAQSSIDGFRLTAQRTGKYAGQLGPYWCGLDGEWYEVWTSSDHPIAAKVGVIRTDFKEPLWAVARYEAYKQTDKNGKLCGMWGKMDAEQTAKCAEALALRRAFPQELSGLYTREEMEQADQPEASPVPKSSPPSTSTPARAAKPSESKQATCADCGQLIEGYKSGKGREYTAADIVKFSVRDFGRALCKKCGWAAKEVKDSAADGKDDVSESSA